MKTFSILYHDVCAAGKFRTSGFASPDADAYKLTDTHFRAHLDAIARRVATSPVTARDILNRTKSDGWMLHFDDGGSSAIERIAPMLEERGWRGHFYIPTDFIGTPGFVTREQVRMLHERGHVVGSHSCSHPRKISALSRTELLREWGESRRVLSEIIGEEVAVASVPGGFYSRGVAEAVAASGYRVLFNSEPVTGACTVNGCLVLGRYSIVGKTPAETAARIVAGAVSPRLAQFLFWNAKKAAKVVAGPIYASIRSSLLRRRVSQVITSSTKS